MRPGGIGAPRAFQARRATYPRPSRRNRRRGKRTEWLTTTQALRRLQRAQSSKTESAQYGVNKTVVHTVTPAGRIQRITAAILVDDAVVKTVRDGKTTVHRQKRTQDELNRIQELAEAAIGFDAKRGDTISVQKCL